MSNSANSEVQNDALLQATKKTVDVLQTRLQSALEAIQVLQMRVETLERQAINSAAASLPMTKHTQNVPYNPSTMAVPLTSGGIPLSPTGQVPQNLFYWPNTSSAPVHSVPAPAKEEMSPATKQLEDDLQRLGLHKSAFSRPAQVPPIIAPQSTILSGHSSPTVSSGLMYPAAAHPHMAPGVPVEAVPGGHTFGSPLTSQSNILPHGVQGLLPGGLTSMMPEGMSAFDQCAPASSQPNGVLHGGNSGNAPATTTLDPIRSTSETLEQVCQQTWLKELCLKGCKNIVNLTPLMRLRNLWKLNLQGCAQYVDDNVVKLIGTYNKRLSRLNLCGCERITDATPLSQLAFLFDLNLSGSQIGNNSLEAISHGCEQLSRLAINSCPQLTSVACVGNLKELKLLYCRYSGNISPSSISVVLRVIGMNLLTLNIDGVRFSQLDLSGLPPATALKNLNFKDNTDVISLDWLTDVPSFEKVFAALEMLDVEGCTSLRHLGKVAQLPSLKTLRLSHTAITTAELARLVSSTSITSIYIDGCAQLATIEPLEKLQSLNKLVLDHQLQSGNAVATGLAALQKRGNVEIIFPNHGSHSYALSVTSPSGSPTAGIVPSMPSFVTGSK